MQTQVSHRVKNLWAYLPITAQSRLDVAFEATWLVGLVLVALLYNGNNYLFFFTQPKQYMVHLIGITFSVLWIFEIALNWRPDAVKSGRPSAALWKRPIVWARKDPSKWLLIFVGLFGVGQALSALFSSSTSTSILGRHPNDPGYEAYATITYLLVLTSMALKMKTVDQVIRFLRVVVFIGTATSLYGVLQFYGWDPFGFGDVLAFSGTRIFSTYGNPIFFASVMVITLPLAIIWALLESRRGRHWSLAIAGMSVGLQAAGVWFTSSRGPTFAILFIVVPAVLLAYFFLCKRKTFYKMVGVGISGTLVAVLLTVVIAGALLDSEDTDFDAAVSGTRLISPAVNAVTSGNINSFSSGRIDIWRGAFELLWSRESVPVEEGFLIKGIRHVFGYGQDRFFLVYPLTAPVKSAFSSASHAHNFPLQIWLELGLWGLLSFTGIVVCTAWILVKLSVKSWKERANTSESLWLGIVVAGLWATLLGRAAEQIPGVGRISDLFLFWMVVGFAVAVYRISTSRHYGETDTFDNSFQKDEQVAVADSEKNNPNKRRLSRSRVGRSKRKNLPNLGRGYNPRPFLMIVAIIAAVAGVVAFVVVDVNPIRGSVLAIKGANKLRCPDERDRAEFLDHFRSAIDLSPKTEEFSIRYVEQTLNVVNSAIDQWGASDTNRAAFEMAVNQLFATGHAVLDDYLEEVPYSHNALVWKLRYLQENLGWLNRLAVASEEPRKAEVARDAAEVEKEYRALLQELSEYFSPFTSVRIVLATNYITLDNMSTEALELARSVINTPVSAASEKSLAYDIIGMRALRMGDHDTAIENLELALVQGTTSSIDVVSTHAALAQAYSNTERFEEAIESYTAAIRSESNPSSSVAVSIKFARYTVQEFAFINAFDDVIGVIDTSGEDVQAVFDARERLARSRQLNLDRREDLNVVEVQLNSLIESSDSEQEYYAPSITLIDELQILRNSWDSFNDVPAEIVTASVPSPLPTETERLLREDSDIEETSRPEEETNTLTDCEF